MKTFVKLSIVLAAYVVAFVVAAGVVHLRELRPQWQATAQASPGMAAFADFILFVEALGVAAAVPTALAGCFLRPFRRIYTVFAAGCPALAATGLIAAVVVVWTMCCVGLRPSPLATRLPWRPCCRIAGWLPTPSIAWSSGRKNPAKPKPDEDASGPHVGLPSPSRSC